MTKKYGIINKVMYKGNHMLKRIIALRDINNPYSLVKEGEIGGFIESEISLLRMF